MLVISFKNIISFFYFYFIFNLFIFILLFYSFKNSYFIQKKKIISFKNMSHCLTLTPNPLLFTYLIVNLTLSVFLLAFGL